MKTYPQQKLFQNFSFECIIQVLSYELELKIKVFHLKQENVNKNVATL
jgi:hypothetical protein